MASKALTTKKTSGTLAKAKKALKGGTASANDNFAASVECVPVHVAVEEFMKIYARLTVEQRALIDLRDGLKPVQRRILWAMRDLKIGYGSGASLVKSARVTGHTMGVYHPHGNTAIYDALVKLTGGAMPLVHGEGSFGWFDGSVPAAERYTEIKMLPFTHEVLLDPDYLRVTEKVPNYDYKDEEPVVLPSKLPMSLVLGSIGIAVGVTASIPSFDAASVIALVRKVAEKSIKNKTKPEATAKQCIKTLDFSSEYGGVTQISDQDFAEVIKTGKGRVQWSCEYEWNKEDNSFQVTGLMPIWNHDKVMEKLAAVPGVSQVANLSSQMNGTESGIDIRIRAMKGENRLSLEPKIKHLLTCAVPVDINLTYRRKVTEQELDSVRSEFMSLGVPEVVNKWFAWRLEIEKLVQQYKIDEWQKQIDYNELLLKAIVNLKIIFDLLQKKGIDKTAELAKALKITKEESTTIWGLSVGKLDRLNLEDVKAKIAALKGHIKNAKTIIAQPALAVVQDMKKLETLV